MRILVTGGAGFIGSHLTTHLSSAGHTVDVIDRIYPGGYWADAHARIHRDCLTIHLSQSIDRNPPDFIYHLASTVGVRNVLADPKEAIENIIESTRAVLSLGIPGMYFSTSEVYGRNDETLGEESEIRLSSKTRWSYAGAKLVCEWLALEAGWKVIRPFNVVGPRQNMAYGAVLPSLVGQWLGGGPLTVHGDGRQIRTFIDVHDFVRIVDELREKDFEVLNVGGIHKLNIRDLAFKVNWTLGEEYPIVYRPYSEVFPPGFEECNRRVPDLTKLHGLIGKRDYKSLNETIVELAKEKQHESVGRRQHDTASNISVAG